MGPFGLVGMSASLLQYIESLPTRINVILSNTACAISDYTALLNPA